MASKYELAHKAWPHLVTAAENRELLTYGDLASDLGLKMAIAMTHALDPLYRLCAEKGWPHLTGIVINAETGKPGRGFEAWSEDELEKRWKEVWEHDWHQYPRPFGPGDHPLVEKSAQELEDWSVPDQQVRVNGRGPFQAALRRDLLTIYGGRCALCDTKHEGLLVASHIVPWSQDQENRRNPHNAVLLCRSHDALFDAGVIRIREDLSVEVVEDPDQEWGSEVDRVLRESTGPSLRLKDEQWQPAAEFLSWRSRKDG